MYTHTTYRYTCRCPPNVCLGNSSCLQGHTGPVCSLCIPGYAMQSGRCRECGTLGVWPFIIAALLGIVVLIFLLFFSWFPLFPLWLQKKLTFTTDMLAKKTADNTQEGQVHISDEKIQNPSEIVSTLDIAAQALSSGNGGKNQGSKFEGVVRSMVDLSLSVFGGNARDYFKILISFWLGLVCMHVQ